MRSLEYCEFNGCDKLTDHLMDVCGIEVNICEECSDKVTDNTGYCTFDCQMGYGCDDSC